MQLEQADNLSEPIFAPIACSGFWQLMSCNLLFCPKEMQDTQSHIHLSVLLRARIEYVAFNSLTAQAGGGSKPIVLRSMHKHLMSGESLSSCFVAVMHCLALHSILYLHAAGISDPATHAAVHLKESQ